MDRIRKVASKVATGNGGKRVRKAILDANGHFAKHHVKKGGRAKGTPNKLPRLLKEALLEAATIHGNQRKYKGYTGLTAWALELSYTRPVSFAVLMGKILPLQITGKDDGPVEVEYRSVDEVKAAMRERGLPVPERIYH